MRWIPCGAAHCFSPCLFPPDNWWNLDISNWPVNPQFQQLCCVYQQRWYPAAPSGLWRQRGNDARPKRDLRFSLCRCFKRHQLLTSARCNLPTLASDGVNHPRKYLASRSYPIPPEAITQPYWIEGRRSRKRRSARQPRPSFADCGSGTATIYTSFSTSTTIACKGNGSPARVLFSI